MNPVTKNSSTAGAGTGQSRQIVVFRLGQEEYGLSIDQIKEVVITPPITRMPQTPPYIRGVANIRGNVIAIIDLEEKFGLASGREHHSQEKNFTLVIEHDEYKIGILVQEVPNTLSVSGTSIEDSVFTGEQGEQSYITGIVKLDKRLIIMIDMVRVMSDHESQQFFRKSQAQPVNL